MRRTDSMSSPVGTLYMVDEDGALTGLYFDWKHPVPDGERGETPLLQSVKRQLEEYFAGSRREFDLPLNPKGTDFQRRVWRALQDISYGETCSYKDIAIAVGSPKGVRAVGMANNRNPISIVVPCHRVIGADGSLVGYGGGLDIKRRLLDMEAGIGAIGG